MPRADLARILARPRPARRRARPLRHEGHRRRRRTPTASTCCSSTTSPPARTTCSSAPTACNSDSPRAASASRRSPSRPAWASGARSSRARPRSSAPSSTTAARSTSPATRRRARTSMYAFLVEKAAGPLRHLRRGGDADHARGVARVRRAVERDPRRPRGRRPRANYTWFTQHIVRRRRGTAAASSSSAMPRTAARPTIAQGAAQAPRGRPRAHRAAARARRASTRRCGTSSTRGALPRATAVVEASVQLGQWQIDGVRTPTCPGLMRRIAMLVSEPA